MHDPKPFARRRLRRLLPAWVCLLAASVALAGEPPTLLRLEADDTPIAGDVKLARGVYRVADAKGDGVLRITQDDGTVAWLYESTDIVSYLEQRFARAKHSHG